MYCWKRYYDVGELREIGIPIATVPADLWETPDRCACFVAWGPLGDVPITAIVVVKGRVTFLCDDDDDDAYGDVRELVDRFMGERETFVGTRG